VKMNDRVRHLHHNSLQQRPITSYFHHNWSRNKRIIKL
jgi:hypothetical protein